jgi:hypothetical protein
LDCAFAQMDKSRIGIQSRMARVSITSMQLSVRG